MNSLYKFTTVALTGISAALFSQTYALDLKDRSQLAANQNLVLSVNTQPPTVDPNQYYDTTSDIIVRNIFRTLVTQTNDGLIPGAAASWTVSPDQKVWTFKLRRDGKWSDGTPVTADDFVFSWQRLVDPQTASQAQNYLADLAIVNAVDIVDGKAPPSSLGVKAIDDYTFQVSLTTPIPWFLAAISFGATAPVPKAVVTKYSNLWIKPENIVSNGAFKLVQSTVNEKIILEPNPYYYNAKNVAITGITINILPNQRQDFLSYLSGNLSFSAVPKQDLVVSQKEIASGKGRLADSSITQVDTLYAYGLALNVKDPILKDIRVRKALQLALNQDELVNKVIRQNQKVSYNWTPNTLEDAQKITKPAYLSESYQTRMNQARKLLADAGYSKNNPLKLSILYPVRDPDDKLIFVAIQNQFETAFQGIANFTLNTQEWKVFLNTIQNNDDYQVIRASWAPDFPHASNFLGIYTCNSSVKYTNYCNPQYDQLFYQAQKEPESSKRADIYAKMQQILTDDAIVIPYYSKVNNIIHSKKLHGFYTNNMNWLAEDMYFTKK